MFATYETLTPTRWTPVPAESARQLAAETAVAIVVNGTTQAVLMATPADLEEFGVGFARTEGIISYAGEVERIEVIDQALGIEVRLWVGEGQALTLAARRRFMAGPTGCGLCGTESLEQAMRDVPLVGRGIRLSSADIQCVMSSLTASRAPGSRRDHCITLRKSWESQTNAADKITSFFDRMPNNLAKPNTSNRRKTHANRGVPDFFTTD